MNSLLKPPVQILHGCLSLFILSIGISNAHAQNVLFPTHEPKRHMDLQHILIAAERNHPQLRQEQFTLKSSIESIAEAKASYMPNISLQASYLTSNREATLRDNTIFDDNSTPKVVSIDATQTLYNGGRRRLNLKSAVLSRNAAKQAYNDVKSDVYSALVENYIFGLTLQRRIEVRKSSVHALQILLKGQKSLFNQGKGTLVEIAVAQARLADANATLTNDLAALDRVKSDIRRDSGVRVEIFLPVTTSLELNQSIEALTEKSLKTSSLLESAKLTHKASLLDLHSIRRERLPTLSLTGQASNSRDLSPTIDRDENVSLGISLNLPLYSGGLQSSRERNAVNQYQAAKYAYQHAKAQISSETASITVGLQAAKTIRESLFVRMKATSLAEKAVRSGRERGFYSVIDVLNRIEEKLAAQLEYISADRQVMSHELLLAMNITDDFIKAIVMDAKAIKDYYEVTAPIALPLDLYDSRNHDQSKPPAQQKTTDMKTPPRPSAKMEMTGNIAYATPRHSNNATSISTSRKKCKNSESRTADQQAVCFGGS